MNNKSASNSYHNDLNYIKYLSIIKCIISGYIIAFEIIDLCDGAMCKQKLNFYHLFYLFQCKCFLLHATRQCKIQHPLQSNRYHKTRKIILLCLSWSLLKDYFEITLQLVQGKKVIAFNSGGLKAELSLGSMGFNTVPLHSLLASPPLLLICQEWFCQCFQKEMIKQKRKVVCYNKWPLKRPTIFS